MAEYTPPTQEEIERVGTYWQRVKLLACQHATGLTFDSSTASPKCSDCDQPLRFMSDIQIEQIRENARRG